VRFFILMLAAATSVFGADSTLWGQVEGGLQLGIDVTSAPGPRFRILLKNAGTEPRDVVIGYEGSVDLYSVEISTNAPGQPEQPVFDSMALGHSPSLVLPIVAHLQPAEVREFTYPLSQLVCVVNRKDVPFRTLWEQGYVVRASFELPGARLQTPDLALRH
jgi:hypothetical protein